MAIDTVMIYRLKDETINVAKSGWITLIVSCALSSLAGQILTKAISKYPDISIFAPILMGTVDYCSLRQIRYFRNIW